MHLVMHYDDFIFLEGGGKECLKMRVNKRLITVQGCGHRFL